MRFLICGAGALGSGIGGMLRARGHEVDFLGFGEHIIQVARRGLDMEGLWGKRHVDGIFATDQARSLTQPEWIILSTKSCDTSSALDGIAHLLPECKAVFCPQNGIGNEEQIALRVGWDRTLGGMVIIGFELMRPGCVRVTVQADSVKVGRLKGPVDSLVEQFVRFLAEADIPVEAVEAVERFKWGKLLYNAALNPLGAILGVRYGFLLAPPTWSIIQDVVREAYEVMDAMGIQPPWPDAKAYLKHLREVQIPATAQHRASMLQDIEAGRKTEIGALNGIVVSRGEAWDIHTPVNKAIVCLIHAMEARLAPSNLSAL